MRIIKSAIVYNCNLPKADDFEELLSQHQFVEIGELEFSRGGFVEAPFNSKFVTILADKASFAFKLRYDEKIIPASVVNAESKKEIAKREETEDRRLPKKERQVIRDEVFSSLLTKALTKTVEITCLYMAEDNLLIVPTTSKKLADIVTGRLIKAIGSIKAKTIYIDGIKQSFTAKLSSYIDGDDHAFSGFEVGCQCKLKGDDSRSASFRQDSLTESKDGIKEAIDMGFKVVEISLSNDDIEFKIDNNFTFKGICFSAEIDPDAEFEDPLEEWVHEATVQAIMFNSAINDITKLFEYKAPAEKE